MHCAVKVFVIILLKTLKQAKKLEIHEKMQSPDSNSYFEWEEDVEFAQKLPKIELHLHLDGSLSPGNFELLSNKISFISQSDISLVFI